ncbi:hypothetical protein TRP8649_03656 [Pelagimonas phthalicica]|uniref:Uncharacterized protein n=1 Tax=Pelagimonas phthalicica TaxID=1037362 RepID=A0A238JFQ9_9RHOB|nr:hypothetical protein [Pelagimonas phthalicica]SMX29520.1 hypothetical protein TRP8649_03656 [Pelagimonas phthalicica]
MLAICNRGLVRCFRRGRSLLQALSDLDAALVQGTLEQPDDWDLTLTAALDLSYEELSPKHQQRLNTFAALAEDTAMPITVLARAWGVDSFTTEECIMDLEMGCWLQPFEFGAPVALRDNVLWYLQNKLQVETQKAALQSILDGNKPDSGHWQDLTSDETYLWTQQLWHMRQAGRQAEADALSQDLPWLSAKLGAVGAHELYRGFDSQHADPGLRWVHRAADFVGTA